MREQTPPDRPVPVTSFDLPIAVDGGSAVQGHCNKIALAPVLARAGLVLAVSGVLVVLFGPGFIIGVALSILGMIFTSSAFLARRVAWRAIQRYVSERYILCDDQGEPVTNGGLTVKPFGGGELEIGYSMDNVSGDRRSAGSPRGSRPVTQ